MSAPGRVLRSESDIFQKADAEGDAESLKKGGDDVASDQAGRENAQRVDVLRDACMRTRASALVRRATECATRGRRAPQLHGGTGRK